MLKREETFGRVLLNKSKAGDSGFNFTEDFTNIYKIAFVIECHRTVDWKSTD